MKKSFFIISILCVILVSTARAQDVLLDEKPDQGINSNIGPNRNYFIQYTMGFGSLVGTGKPGLSYNDLMSNDIRVGVKLKRRISGVLSFWLEPEYHYAAYNINQGNYKITDSLFWNSSSAIKHVKERFATEGVLFNGFFRFNFDPHRGNFLGYYVDLGGGFDYYIDREYLAIDKKNDGSEVRTSYSNIPYMNGIGYNAMARIGINWFALTFNYRLTNVFKSQYNIAEPPVCTVGIEVNPYGH